MHADHVSPQHNSHRVWGLHVARRRMHWRCARGTCKLPSNGLWPIACEGGVRVGSSSQVLPLTHTSACDQCCEQQSRWLCEDTNELTLVLTTFVTPNLDEYVCIPNTQHTANPRNKGVPALPKYPLTPTQPNSPKNVATKQKNIIRVYEIFSHSAATSPSLLTPHTHTPHGAKYTSYH